VTTMLKTGLDSFKTLKKNGPRCLRTNGSDICNTVQKKQPRMFKTVREKANSKIIKNDTRHLENI
jgi:hypothetical protein